MPAVTTKTLLGMLCVTIISVFINSCSFDVAGGSELGNEKIILAGMVVDDKNVGVTNIVVQLVKTRFSDTTDRNGNFKISVTGKQLQQMSLSLDTIHDTLAFLKEGSVKSVFPVKGIWVDTSIRVRLLQREISGFLITDETQFRKIEAVIRLIREPENSAWCVPLGYTQPDYQLGRVRYSGFAFFSPSAETDTFAVYVRVFNKDSVLSGKSKTQKFTCIAGNIWLPDFYPNNLKPLVKACNDTTVSVYDTVFFHWLQAEPSIEKNIISYEWRFYGGNFIKTTTGDTPVQIPQIVSDSITVDCILRITDSDNLTAQDTVKVTILKDVPRVSLGNDTVVTMNSAYLFHAQVTQKFGTIRKWEWRIGTGSYNETGSGDTTVPTTSSFWYQIPCSLRVTDDDGNVAYGAKRVTVGAWEYNYIMQMNLPLHVSAISVFKNCLYVSYQSPVDNKYRVLKFIGKNWEDMTFLDPPQDKISILSLAASETYLYALVLDRSDEGVSKERIKVLRFKEYRWEPVDALGVPVLSSSQSQGKPILSIAGDTLCVAFTIKNGTGSKSYVMYRIDNAWRDISGDLALDSVCGLAVFEHTPYIAFKDKTAHDRISVKYYSYTRGTWEYAGIPGLNTSNYTGGLYIASGGSSLYLTFWEDYNHFCFKQYSRGVWTDHSIQTPCKEKLYSSLVYSDQWLYLLYNGAIVRYNGSQYDDYFLKHFQATIQPNRIEHGLITADKSSIYLVYNDNYFEGKNVILQLK